MTYELILVTLQKFQNIFFLKKAPCSWFNQYVFGQKTATSFGTVFLRVELQLIKCLLLLHNVLLMFFRGSNPPLFSNSCYLMVSNIHSKTLTQFSPVSHFYTPWKRQKTTIFFCIVLKGSYILKRLWTFASAHSKYS